MDRREYRLGDLIPLYGMLRYSDRNGREIIHDNRSVEARREKLLALYNAVLTLEFTGFCIAYAFVR